MRAVVCFRTTSIEAEVVWITEYRRGFSIGIFDPVGDVHFTWHMDGMFHMKGPGRAHGRHQRQALTAFTGWQQTANQSIPFLIEPRTIAGRPISNDARVSTRIFVDREELRPMDTLMLDAFLIAEDGREGYEKWIATPKEGSDLIRSVVLDLDHFPNLKLGVALYRFLR